MQIFNTNLKEIKINIHKWKTKSLNKGLKRKKLKKRKNS
jgi:hypothetical protein